MPFEWVEKPMPPIGEADYEIGEGWRPLVTELESLLRAVSPDYKVVQVKQKFGGLRYYADYVPAPGAPVEFEKVFLALIRLWEGMSQTVCEECGEYGTPSTHKGWMRTLCRNHRIA